MVAKKITFEEALEKLELNVKSLESGDLPLNEVLKLFEEGVGLVQTCYQKLNEAEQKIQVLSKSLKERQQEESEESEEENQESEY
ncbi:exodeoxyribonuclease VII small subunit [Dehalobacterium formicoaceticum]|uniref:Exodeoxyribonuclease 7 small subunit n=1 Tax=Dehalobacterium formicoaceticum TaxID=51515 RepID=A0ABT1Y4J6_9FIRM|nr:exodeoxyribonuclease VII small subunit [Dehalobacterium formicoaceticum]MCR6545797.1 exodeoxyribonuclease VII small subunit [Dehalobacterium formicoaceticum]